MKILHLLSSPYWSGPMENVALLAQEQNRLGHSASVAIDLRRHQAPAEELAAPRLEQMQLLASAGLELSVKSRPWNVTADAFKLRKSGADVIHSHFTHDHLLARWAAPRRSILVRSIHAERSIRRTLPRADAWTFPPEVDPEGRSPFMTLLPLLSPAYRPPDSRPAVQRALGIFGSPTIGMVSTFQPSRRHLLALDAFVEVSKESPEARMFFVGDGKLEPVVRAAVAEKGLSSFVTFAGYQKGENFVRWLQALDEVWVLGLGNDYSGRAAAQARACGARVVAVEEGGLSGFADVTVEPDAASIARASLSGSRRKVALPSAADIAAEVVRLYETAAG